MKQKTVCEVVEDTINFYTEDPSRRAVDDGRCLYLAPDGKKCAVGRYIDWDKVDKLGYDSSYINLIGGVHGFSRHSIPLNSILKDEVKDIDIDVWKDLQGFHDTVIYWGDERFISNRDERIKQLKEEYCQ